MEFSEYRSRTFMDNTRPPSVNVNPVPHEVVIMPNGHRWLWLPQEVLTSYAAHLFRTELIDVHLSNLYEWRRTWPKQRLCPNMNGDGLKWHWSLALHGLEPPFNPRERCATDKEIAEIDLSACDLSVR